jgi:hypothetical protein
MKMSVLLSTTVVDAIRDLAKKRGTSMTTVICQAIGTEKFLDEVGEASGRVFIKSRRGKVRELVFR